MLPILKQGEVPNSFGESINGRIYKLSGSDLEAKIVVSGLPVSDHDHGKHFLRSFGALPSVACNN